jgi:tRNA-Thr(GGU) m(6)t(6)A37 methyltransferase TsaA
LTDRAAAPRQGDEGAPAAWLMMDPEFAPGLDGLEPGAELLVLTWCHQSRRDVLVTRPRDDPSRPERGIFTPRSPDRPNPIGVQRVRILAIEGARLQVHPLEAIDGTPILDLKPVLAPLADR